MYKISYWLQDFFVCVFLLHIVSIFSNRVRFWVKLINIHLALFSCIYYSTSILCFMLYLIVLSCLSKQSTWNTYLQYSLRVLDRVDMVICGRADTPLRLSHSCLIASFSSFKKVCHPCKTQGKRQNARVGFCLLLLWKISIPPGSFSILSQQIKGMFCS